MNFDFSDEQKLLQTTARDFLERDATLAVCRRVLESAQEHYAADLWKETAKLGWQGTAIPEEHGGAGFGYLELVLIAEEIGRALAPIPFSSSVYLATEAVLQGGSPAQQAAWLPGLAKGESIGTLAIVEGPGRLSAESIQTTFRDGRLDGIKRAVPDGAAADHAIVAARTDEGVVLVRVDLNGEGVKSEEVPCIDPSHSNTLIRLDQAPAERLEGAKDGWALLEWILHRAAVLQAFEQIGGAARALDATRTFTMERFAFGRSIASFQALKHRMADIFTDIEIARSNGFYAAWALASDAKELGEAACNARITATDAFDNATREMIQMYGGVGYTWEYDCHLFYRRANWLAASLGPASEWRERLIGHLTAEAVE